MQRKAIQTEDAPKAIGPYSQAIRTDSWMFLSGQLALDPKTGEFISPNDVRGQIQRVMENVRAVLRAEQLGFEHVVKSTIFLTDLQDFATVNEVYGSYFQGMDPPARSTIQVAALPRGAKVEVEIIAQVG